MQGFDPGAAALAGSGIFGLPSSEQEARVVLLPVPFDATTSYHRGAACGPRAILSASRQVDLFDIETGRPYAAGIHMLEEPEDVLRWNEEASRAAAPIIARGGLCAGDPELGRALARVNELGEAVTERVRAESHERLAAGKIVGVIGGDHSVSLGAICAHAERFPGLGILHVDAHADLRVAYEGFIHSHASIMANVLARAEGVSRIVQVAVRDLCEEEALAIRQSRGRVETFFDAELRRACFEGEPWARICERIVGRLPQHVYISFDIDGLDPALCPHTGTPVPGGLSFAEATALLRALVRAGRRIVGFDLTEVTPSVDERDDWDGNVGARVLYKLIGFTLLSQ